jgi:hypothetical protein
VQDPGECRDFREVGVVGAVASSEVSASATGLEETILEQGVTACLAEYQSLIGEMRWLREEAQYQRLSVTLLVGLVPLLGLVSSISPDLLIPTLLVAPVPFAVLGYLFFRQHEEVYVVAAYLRDQVRPRIRNLTAQPAIWGWEEFKHTHFESGRHGVLGLLNSGKVALMMRLLLFLLPAVVSTIAAAAVALVRNPGELLPMYGWVGAGLAVALFALDVLLIALLVTTMWSRGDLAVRLLGMTSDPPLAN